VCVLYGEAVYCIGGVCGPQALNSVERILASEILLSDGSSAGAGDSSASLGWTECASLHENRSACGAVVLPQESPASCEKVILVCGGITTGGDTVSSTEIFSDKTQVSLCASFLPSSLTRTQTWEPATPMLTPRRSFGICAFKGKAFAIGGNDGTRDLNSVEVYDPQTNAWSVLSPFSPTSRLL
jgi:hypothetical protein